MSNKNQIKATKNAQILSPPSLCLLTIGSFATLYYAWFNYPRSKKEIPYAISDITIDLATIGVGVTGVEWFYRHNMKPLAWWISVVPVMIVITVALLVILIRIKTEKELKPAKVSNKVEKLSPKIKKKIMKRVKRVVNSV